MASINRHFKLEGWAMVGVFAAPLAIGIAAAVILPTVRNETKTGGPLSQSTTIENPCTTFVAEFSPVETPFLRSASGELELVLSFTPAKNEEAERLISVVSAGAQKLLLKQEHREIKVLRIEQQRLVVSVESAAHAADVLELLCFDEKYRKPKLQGAS